MRARGNKWWVLGTVDLALFMVLIDRTIVNIAVPHIMQELQGSLTGVTWVLNGYILAFVVSLIIAGRMGDLWGRRRLFLVGLTVFTVASAINGLAFNLPMLIGSRVVQGFGGALMMPQTLSLLTVTFPAEQRGLAMGLWGAVSGLATAVGPTLGGFLVSFASWRWIFFVNLPIGLLTFFAALRVVQESTAENAQPKLDWLGMALIVVITASATYAVIEGQKRGWSSALIVALLATSAAGLVAFYFVERGRPHALMPPSLFRNRTFTAASLTGLLLFFGLVGVTFLLPLFLQGQLGFTAVRTGILLTPLSGAIMIFGPVSGRLSDRFGGKWLIFAGMLVATAGIYLLTWLTVQVETWRLLFALGVAGLGIGLAMAPTTSVVMGSVGGARVGNASGILGTFRMMGAVLGVAILSDVLQSQLVARMSGALDALPGVGLEEKARLLARMREGARAMMGGAGPGLPGRLGELLAREFLGALHTAFVVAAAVALAGAVVALVIPNDAGRKRGRAA